MSPRTLGLAVLITILSRPVLSPAAEEEDLKRKAFLTAKEAGADFEIQGEYTGTVSTNDGDKTYGVQVIALGKGTFRAVAYPGGLPGAGFNGDEKTETDGELKNGAAVFKRDEVSAVINDGKLVIKNAGDVEIGTFNKVIRKSPTLGKKPPAGAVVLFDGKSAENFKGGRLTDDGLLMEGVTSRRKFPSCQLHLEFQLSFMPHARGQGRSNSGCYLQGRYEVQILDSFGLEGKHNECGGIYEIRDPDVNMCLPPLAWQTYDVDYTAARFDADGKKLANARMTVRHNGVVIHKDVELPRATRAAPVKEGPDPGPLYIQNHGNPLRFRNIWLVEKK